MRFYYIDSHNGNDDYDGNSPGSAWASFRNINKIYDTTTLNPGDKILIKKDSFFRERLMLVGNGTQDKPIEVNTYGEGFTPQILGSIEANDNWVKYSDNIWYREMGENFLNQEWSFSYGDDEWVGGVFYGDEPSDFLLHPSDFIGRSRLSLDGSNNINSNINSLEQNGDYFYDNNTNRLYIYSDDNKNPLNRFNHIEVTDKDSILIIGSYINIKNISIKYANNAAISSWYAENITIENCEISFSGGASSNLLIFIGGGIYLSGYYNNINIKNNRFRNMLSSCVCLGPIEGNDVSCGNIYIENNYLYNYLNAISYIPTVYGGSEGTRYFENLIVQNNSFINKKDYTDYLLSRTELMSNNLQGVLGECVSNFLYFTNEVNHKNFIFKHNTFNTYSSSVITALNIENTNNHVENLVFSYNKVESRGSYKDSYSDAQVYLLNGIPKYEILSNDDSSDLKNSISGNISYNTFYNQIFPVCLVIDKNYLQGDYQLYVNNNVFHKDIPDNVDFNNTIYNKSSVSLFFEPGASVYYVNNINVSYSEPFISILGKPYIYESAVSMITEMTYNIYYKPFNSNILEKVILVSDSDSGDSFFNQSDFLEFIDQYSLFKNPMLNDLLNADYSLEYKNFNSPCLFNGKFLNNYTNLDINSIEIPFINYTSIGAYEWSHKYTDYVIKCDDAKVGYPYSYKLYSFGHYGPYTYETLNSLPNGLSLDNDTGVISGIPLDKLNDGVFIVKVTDINNNSFYNKYSLNILSNMETTSTFNLMYF